MIHCGVAIVIVVKICAPRRRQLIAHSMPWIVSSGTVELWALTENLPFLKKLRNPRGRMPTAKATTRTHNKAIAWGVARRGGTYRAGFFLYI